MNAIPDQKETSISLSTGQTVKVTLWIALALVLAVVLAMALATPVMTAFGMAPL